MRSFNQRRLQRYSPGSRRNKRRRSPHTVPETQFSLIVGNARHRLFCWGWGVSFSCFLRSFPRSFARLAFFPGVAL